MKLNVGKTVSYGSTYITNKEITFIYICRCKYVCENLEKVGFLSSFQINV
jgi:hypothetical protein